MNLIRSLFELILHFWAGLHLSQHFTLFNYESVNLLVGFSFIMTIALTLKQIVGAMTCHWLWVIFVYGRQNYDSFGHPNNSGKCILKSNMCLHK